MHYQSSIGRLNKQQTHPYGGEKTEIANEIIVNNTLPIFIDYETIRKIKVVNPQQASIVHAELIFLPFYILKFSIINQKRKIFGHKEIISEENFLINAISGEVLSQKPIEFDYKNILFSKNKLQNKEIKEKIKDLETNLIIQSVKNTITRENYKIKTDGSYAVTINKSEYPPEAAERKIVEDIVERKKVRYEDVKVLEDSEILVPKWFVIIECQGLTYVREAIASTDTIFHNELDLCPKDTGKEKRKTYAIREVCGMAICSKHIIQENGKFLCHEHKISRLSSIKKVPHIEIDQVKNSVQSIAQNLFRTKNEVKEAADSEKIPKEDPINVNDYDPQKDNSQGYGSPIKW